MIIQNREKLKFILRLKSYKILKRNRTFSTFDPDDDNKSKTFGFFLKFYNFLAL